jgi:hypothetical protein
VLKGVYGPPLRDCAGDIDPVAAATGLIASIVANYSRIGRDQRRGRRRFPAGLMAHFETGSGTCCCPSRLIFD